MSVKISQVAKGVKSGPAQADGSRDEQADSQRRTVSVEEAGRILGNQPRRGLYPREGRQHSDNPLGQAASRPEGCAG